MKGFKSMIKAPKKGKGPTVATNIGEPMNMKPRVFIDSKEMPAIKDWKVGGEYTLKVRQVSRTARDSEEEGRGSVSGEFEVIGVEGEDEESEKLDMPKKKAGDIEPMTELFGRI